MVKIPTKIRYDSKNLVCFTADFICAGVRDNILGMYNFLKEKGAILVSPEEDTLLISSKKDIVLFCMNAGINNKFAKISLKRKTWWNYYHNKSIKINRPTYYTYNLPSQWNIMLDNACTWKEVETLEAE